MLKSELYEVIQNGENSGVEFKRDDVHPDSFAKEITALLNLEGGQILLGVEDDGTVSGLTHGISETEEWLMNVCRDCIQPSIIPYYETLRWEDTKIGVITIPSDSPDKPYKAKRGSAWITFVRVGSTSREATREEEARLYQSSGLMRYDIKPVPGTTMADLDLHRLQNYFRDIRQQDCPPIENQKFWQQLLINTDLMVENRGRAIPTTGAILLFGRNPNRRLPQAGITAVAYPETEKDYATRERSILRYPIVPLLTEHRSTFNRTNLELKQNGLVGQAMDFVRRNSAVEAWIDNGGQRHDRWKDYPLETVRECVVNAIAHRDYTIRPKKTDSKRNSVTDIELSLYSDRLEVISPGRLPNTVTVEKMKLGYRATRNELIKEVLRDYRYIESTGMGVPRKIIRGMREHNGTEPDLIEEEDRFIVRLWKYQCRANSLVL